MNPAGTDAQKLLTKVAQELTGDPDARVVVIMEGADGMTIGYSTTVDVAEIRGLMFRAAVGLPGR
jgi:hypothetical protein